VEALVEEVLKVSMHASHRVLRTLRELTFRPGETIRSYLDGKRKTYQDPVSFFAFGYLLLEAVNRFVLRPQNLPDTIITRLGRSGTFAGMAVDAVASYYIVTRPELSIIETLAAFAFVYGMMFFDAAAIALVIAAFRDFFVGLPPSIGEMLFDIPLILILFVYFTLVSRALVGPRTLRLIIALAFGAATFVFFRALEAPLGK